MRVILWWCFYLARVLYYLFCIFVAMSPGLNSFLMLFGVFKESLQSAEYDIFLMFFINNNLGALQSKVYVKYFFSNWNKVISNFSSILFYFFFYSLFELMSLELSNMIIKWLLYNTSILLLQNSSGMLRKTPTGVPTAVCIYLNADLCINA